MSKGNGPNKGRNLKKYSEGYDNIDFSNGDKATGTFGYVKLTDPSKIELWWNEVCYIDYIFYGGIYGREWDDLHSSEKDDIIKLYNSIKDE